MGTIEGHSTMAFLFHLVFSHAFLISSINISSVPLPSRNLKALFAHVTLQVLNLKWPPARIRNISETCSALSSIPVWLATACHKMQLSVYLGCVCMCVQNLWAIPLLLFPIVPLDECIQFSSAAIAWSYSIHNVFSQSSIQPTFSLEQCPVVPHLFRKLSFAGEHLEIITHEPCSAIYIAQNVPSFSWLWFYITDTVSSEPETFY